MAKNEFEAILELTEKAELRTKEFNKLRSSMKEYGSQEYKRVKGYAALQEKINTNLEKALKTRASLEAKTLKEVSERMRNNHLEMINQIKERQKAEESSDKVALKKHNDELKRLHEVYAQEKKNAQQVIDGITKYSKSIDELNDRARGSIFDPQIGFFGSGAKLKDFDKNVEFMETRLVGAAEAVGDAFSGNLDTVMSRIDRIGKGTGNFLKDIRTTAKMKYGSKAAEGDMGAKSILAVTKGLGKFGAVLGGLTVGLGALFAVFKIAQSIEEAIKGVNKELLDTYGASDLVGAGMTNVYENVNLIRKELSDPDFANTLGVSLEEARGLAAEFQNIGVNFMSLSEDGQDIRYGIEQMKDATIEFQASAKTLGVGFGELVDFGRDLTQEMGVSVAHGAGLERMSREFGRIRDLAKQSALSTKDFFGVIKDLSNGMGTMNVRIGEAANLFTRLGKVMGPEAAQAFVKNLAGAFKGEGIQDRFKRIILTGNMKGVFKRSAEQSKKDFFSIYKSGKIKQLFKEINLDRSTDLAKMSDADLEKAMGVLRRKGGVEGEGAARKLMQNVRLARGGKGGLSAQALALGDLDMTGAFSAQMKQLYNVTGGKGFRDVTAIEMEKISQMTGKSIEELEGMRQIDMAMRDDFRVLQEIQKANTDSLGRKDPLKIKDALEKAGLKDLKVDEKGNVVDKEGRRIDNIQDYIASQGSALDAVKTGTYDQLSVLGEVVEATQNSATMINNHLGGLLQQINNPLQFMADIAGKNDKSRGERREVAEQMRNKLESDKSGLVELKKKQSADNRAERARISQIKDMEKRTKAEEKLQAKILKEKEEYATKEKEFKAEQERINLLMGAAGRKIQLSEGDRDKLESGELSKEDALKKLADQAENIRIRKKARTKFGRSELTDEQAIVSQIYNELESQGVKVSKEAKSSTDDLLKFLENQYGESGYVTGVTGGGIQNAEQRKELLQKILASGRLKGESSATGVDSRLSMVRRTKSGLSVTDAEGRTLDLTQTQQKKYSTIDDGYRTTTSGGATVSRKEERDKVKEGVESEEQLNKLNANIEKMGNGPTEYEMAKQEELRGKVEAKNRVLLDARKKVMVEALLEKDRKQLENKTRAEFDGFFSKGSFDTKSGRASYIAQIEAKLKKVNKVDEPERYNELLQLRRDFKTYYAQDAALSPGQAGPPFIGNAGTLVRGTDTDTAMLVDFTKAGSGGGGARGNVIFNVNGNNESAMIAQIESYLRSLGFIS